MNTNRSDFLRIVILPILEALLWTSAFWIAYNLRSITDGIPFVQLRIPYISPEQFAPFVGVGVAIWLLVFIRAKLYSHIRAPIFAEIKKIISYSFIWFFFYIGVVYLTQGFIFSKEIPRLIIFYTLILGTVFSIFLRIFVDFFWKFLQKKKFFHKQKILLIQENKDEDLPFEIDFSEAKYERVDMYEVNKIEALVRSGQVDAILVVSAQIFEKKFEPILTLARIYGVRCVHPQIMPNMRHFSREETYLAGVPVFSLSAVSITPWERVLKRIVDIFLATFFLILASPIMIIAAVGIWLEDRSGPIIYRNRRIGQDGSIFTLFKFRYMYWKDSTKEDYLAEGERDEALELEEKLKKTADNSRSGPLYKIKNDPRIMKFGGILEKFSIDELPQLFNVLIGNMSIVGPRPHQPREVALYDESDKQVLTIKP